mmetsp:Transcript_9427/g.31315  ORF Transcript_9427/g.31315 Transcript_9427/m.31315 type:complete len:215 (-) Transcript_9427:152-796(-)
MATSSSESGQEPGFSTGDKGSWPDDGPGAGPHWLMTAGDAETDASGIQYVARDAGAWAAAWRRLADMVVPTSGALGLASTIAVARSVGVIICVCQSKIHAPNRRVRSVRRRLPRVMTVGMATLVQILYRLLVLAACTEERVGAAAPRPAVSLREVRSGTRPSRGAGQRWIRHLRVFFWQPAALDLAGAAAALPELSRLLAAPNCESQLMVSLVA